MAGLIRKLRSVVLREDHICPWWLSFIFDNPARKLLQDPEKILGGLVEPGMTVADIGCGMGYFSVAMARMVRPGGKVLSADIQQKMLDHLMKRARRQGVAGMIETRLIPRDDIGIREKVDFILAFWMVHETGDISRFMKQVSNVLRPGGKMLIAEPRGHVPAGTFERILQHARNAGFSVSPGPHAWWSRTAVLVKN